jgi:hypothetical protein
VEYEGGRREPAFKAIPEDNRQTSTETPLNGMRKSQRIRKITEAQKEINKPSLYAGKFRQSKRN